ncbi:hypothetical protein Afil01_56840 [Actinorhabdospora filicis]|uniref:Secreted protein n=1 Tax=Actinorhabdospora filicis TaxID=1785913 RepID=A0A9W6SRG6_9ACTN|nr:hypothetical protein [Actinorhabdospora filicis]GLZ80877.1 hypothetical protein Afil01_56840 [Actinorhabdospora filicis]
MKFRSIVLAVFAVLAAFAATVDAVAGAPDPASAEPVVASDESGPADVAECDTGGFHGDGGPATRDLPPALPLAGLPASPDLGHDRPDAVAAVPSDAPAREFVEPPA